MGFVREFKDFAFKGNVIDLAVAVIIGGAFGVSDILRQAVNYKLSFSPMTFTHQMVRLLLVEQIYRASKINRNEPYHW